MNNINAMMTLFCVAAMLHAANGTITLSRDELHYVVQRDVRLWNSMQESLPASFGADHFAPGATFSSTMSPEPSPWRAVLEGFVSAGSEHVELRLRVREIMCGINTVAYSWGSSHVCPRTGEVLVDHGWLWLEVDPKTQLVTHVIDLFDVPSLVKGLERVAGWPAPPPNPPSIAPEKLRVYAEQNLVDWTAALSGEGYDGVLASMEDDVYFNFGNQHVLNGKDEVTSLLNSWTAVIRKAHIRLAGSRLGTGGKSVYFQFEAAYISPNGYSFSATGLLWYIINPDTMKATHIYEIIDLDAVNYHLPRCGPADGGAAGGHEDL